MKMRKLFAGIAAAATLLGGLAVGATSASAAEITVNDDATFTFTADSAEQLKNAKLVAYKIGDYVQYGTTQIYGVTTNEANKTAVDNALASVFTDFVTDDQDNLAAALNEGKLDISATRPWNTTAEGVASTSRAFADALAKEDLAGKEIGTLDPTGSDEDGYEATVTLPAGIYLFLDANTSTVDKVTVAIPMIVASGTVENNALTDPVNGANTVNMKNTKSTVRRRKSTRRTQPLATP